jgi:hypothetical protein
MPIQPKGENNYWENLCLMDHCHPRGKPMRSFGRIAVMVVVSLLTLAICAGGFENAFIGFVIVMLFALPLIGIITLFHFFERRSGPYARHSIASIGLFPLLLVILFGGRGDTSYMAAIVLAGLTWSAAWLATSHTFYRVPRKETTDVS